ncbi:wall-associated receptor kinase 2-like [Raphanus sativus]|uniref:Wall-associated receptor kinase 2-like n=1 Tax=Raphanus sativus TaxID=3726 RepID=A0A6J0M090_RAPSA|nr:wall-associated receptor kinase 2-like [Raphanus sativus]
MNMVVHGLFLVAILILASTKLVMGQSTPICQTKCGNVSIEFPFGLSTGCYYAGQDNFNLTCNETTNELFFFNMQVINIAHSGELRVLQSTSFTCYNSENNTNELFYNTNLVNFTLSNKNRFTAVGCNTYAFMTTFKRDRNYSTGCLSLCDSTPKENGLCSGDGCCQTSVPKRSRRFRIRSRRFDRETSVSDFNPCFYAFLVEDGMFSFSPSQDLQNLRNVTKFPIVLDWSIGEQTCLQVGNTSICGKNSECLNSTTRTGYNCKCKAGYEGNPYLLDGCQDIDECTTSSTIYRHNCSASSTCNNTMGHFLCYCPPGYNLNATNNSCMRKGRSEYYGWTRIFLATTVGFLAILLVFGCVEQKIKHRKNTELRKHFFEQNGGGMLRQRLSGAGTSNSDVKIFTEEGMKEATNGYEESRILGQGGQGTVYKGILPDNSVVAIKKARLGDSSQVEQFINEVLVLSQINHRNVVKLLGCCLETEVPLLVYEFINSGTLYDHLHGSMSNSYLTWEHRLRIAVEIAGTLAYLHSSASIPIIHRDVKTANILLDENLTAKVADFGASRLIPMDKEQLTTMVQGTLGYLDPEYYNTGLLNEKSDVYSFGVVLMELLTGQKALCFEKPQQSKHLVNYFACAMKEDRLHEVVDSQVMKENNQREIHEAARIAVECTRLMGEERPRMKEVAAQLEALGVAKTKHELSDQYNEPEVNKHLVGVEILPAQGDTGTTGYDSIKNVTRLNIEAGR